MNNFKILFSFCCLLFLINAIDFNTELPIIKIHVHGKEIMNRDTRIMSDMYIIDNGEGKINNPNDEPISPKGLQADIRYRGHSSMKWFKKNYSLNTKIDGKKVKYSPLGFPEGQKFIFYAVGGSSTYKRGDKYLNNWINFNLYRQFGRYATRTKFFILYMQNYTNEGDLNKQYEGVYCLYEKYVADPMRINITKGGGDSLDRGYILRKGGNKENPKVNKKPCSKGSQKMDYPDEPTQQQLDFIGSVRNALVCDGTYAKGCYRNVIDECSFFDDFILQQYSTNIDTFNNNMYYHTDQTLLISAGPVWDMDHTFRQDHQTEWIEKWKEAIYWENIMFDEHFKIRLLERYEFLRSNVLSDSNVLRLVAIGAKRIEKDIDKEKFKVSFQTYYKKLVEYISKRGKWMDTEIYKYLNVKKGTKVGKMPLCEAVIYPANIATPRNIDCPPLDPKNLWI